MHLLLDKSAVDVSLSTTVSSKIAKRASSHPTMGYVTYYSSLLEFVDVLSLVPSSEIVLVEIAKSLAIISPFLAEEQLQNYFDDFINLIAVSGTDHQEAIINILCESIIPQLFVHSNMGRNQKVVASFPALMLAAFEHLSHSNLQSSLCEALLMSKQNCIVDLIYVIAFGTTNARIVATALLFRYWPMLNCLEIDKRSLILKIQTRNPPYCQSSKCIGASSIASWICGDDFLAVHGINLPPPYYLCNTCYNLEPDAFKAKSRLLVQPVNSIDQECANPQCRSSVKDTYAVCYSIECCLSNHKKPMSLCLACHENIHEQDEDCDHVYQTSLPEFPELDHSTRSCLVEAIISLLKESVLSNTNIRTSTESDNENSRRLLSTYGINLLINFFDPASILPPEVFAMLLSVLFQWFTATTCLPDDGISNLMEKLKVNYVLPWLRTVVEEHSDLIIALLVPNSVAFAKIGFVWDNVTGESAALREGLNILYNLIPYDIITEEIWNSVIPYWLEVIFKEINDNELHDFKPLFRKLFDTEMSPMLLSQEAFYRFLIERFESPSPASVQEQALCWLQLLCRLDVAIPFDLLLDFMHFGIQSLLKLESRASRREAVFSGDHQVIDKSKVPCIVFDTYETYRAHRNQLMLQQLTGREMVSIIKEEEEEFIINENELNATCCLLMLDVLYKQVEIQSFPPQFQGMYHPISKRIVSLLNAQLMLPWFLRHRCQAASASSGKSSTQSCLSCEIQLTWYNLCKRLLKHISPRDEVKLQDLEFPNTTELKRKREADDYDRDDGDTLIDSTSAQNIGGFDHLAENRPEHGIWITSKSVYHFKLSTILPHMQLFYYTLKEINRVHHVDALYDLLSIIHTLVLNDEVLETSAKTNVGFLTYCAEKMIIPSLWRIFKLGYCQLNELCVTLLLHTVAHEQGKLACWNAIEHDFNSNDWQVRASAVTAVISISEQLSLKKIKSHYHALSLIAFAFMNISLAIEDIEPAVSLKALTITETISDQSLKAILNAFEFQFDSVINDRNLVLQHVYKLFLSLFKQNRHILNWDFFMNRFDTLFLENQILLEELGEIISPTSISGSNTESEHFNRKLNLIRFALDSSDEVTKLSASPRAQFRRSLFDSSGVEKNEKFDEKYPAFSSTKRRVSSFDTNIEVQSTLQEVANESRTTTTEMVEGRNENTLHALVQLLMQYMLVNDQLAVEEDRIDLKHQNLVLRHLFKLMGYERKSDALTKPPIKLRRSAVFRAFLADLSKVLDNNFRLGNVLLPYVLKLLHYCPAPNSSANCIRMNAYSICNMEVSLRLAWANAVCVILYKYQINMPEYELLINRILKIMINSINTFSHDCSCFKCTESHALGVEYRQDSKETEDGAPTDRSTSVVNEKASVLPSDSPKKMRWFFSKPQRFQDTSSLTVATSPFIINKKETGSSKLKATSSYADFNRDPNTSVDPRILEKHSMESGRGIFSYKADSLRMKNPMHRVPSDLFHVKSKRSRNVEQLMSKNKTKLSRTSVHKISHIKPKNELSGSCELCGAEIENIHMSSYFKDKIHEYVEVNLFKNSWIDEESGGLCIIACLTLVHNEPTLSASLLIDMYAAMSRVAGSFLYTWQDRNSTFIPGNCKSIARQFIRCSLLQLAPNGVFYQLFQHPYDESFFETMANSISEFPELPPHAALKRLLNDFCAQKLIAPPIYNQIIANLAIYMQHVPIEGFVASWSPLFEEFERFFTKLISTIVKPATELNPILQIVKRLLSVPHVSTAKTLTEPLTKILCHVLQDSNFSFEDLLDLSNLCYKAFLKDRDRFFIARAVISTFFDYINAREICADRNVLLMIQFILVDIGGVIYSSPVISNEMEKLNLNEITIQTLGAEYMRSFTNEIITFISDVHAVSRLKTFICEGHANSINLSIDTLGGQIKAGLAQYLSLEFTKYRDSKMITRLLPWLYTPPSPVHGVEDYQACIDHLRFLSWLLAGSLTHTAITKNEAAVISQPIPIDASLPISDRVMYVITEFTDQSKKSVAHMSALFHSVVLCQLWTMYCEQFQADTSALDAIMAFWTRITPGILQLLANSKSLADMMNLHFLNLIEALQESNSVVLAKLFPLWEPVLHTHPSNLPSHILIRLQACLNFKPSIESHNASMFKYTILLKWLQRLQFKMVQIELQSSHASQFYTL
ncbi:hypothetical protein ACOME3_001094 [Neoechinorhynchus agilis]